MSSVEIFYEDIEPLNLDDNTIENYINNLVENESKSPGDVTVIFCSDDYLLDINIEYLSHNYYTDIITFDYVEGNTISGDLFISFDRLKDNAQSYNTELVKEVLRVIFHGVLHLVGYNDKTGDEKKIMREKENYYLSKVDFKTISL